MTDLREKSTGPDGSDVCQADQEAKTKSQAEEQTLTGMPLTLLTIALVSAMFLVALVCSNPCIFTVSSSHNIRIEPSSRRPCLEYPTNFMQ